MTWVASLDAASRTSLTQLTLCQSKKRAKQETGKEAVKLPACVASRSSSKHNLFPWLHTHHHNEDQCVFSSSFPCISVNPNSTISDSLLTVTLVLVSCSLSFLLRPYNALYNAWAVLSDKRRQESKQMSRSKKEEEESLLVKNSSLTIVLKINAAMMVITVRVECFSSLDIANKLQTTNCEQRTGEFIREDYKSRQQSSHDDFDHLQRNESTTVFRDRLEGVKKRRRSEE